MSDEISHAKKVMLDLVWRLEILQHRARYNVRTGAIITLPTRIRRFANAHPQDLTASVLAELVAAAPYSGVVYNGDDEGDALLYRPTSTYIRKDDTLKTGTRDHTYTIVQDLVLIDESGDSLGIADASSCSRVTTSVYRWDEGDVEDCPDGSQGVSYRITGVSRDKETDLFSYQVERSVAVTQHMPEKTSLCDGEKTVTVETWDNVYGGLSDDDPFRFNGTDLKHPETGGNELGLPDPCESATGEKVEIQVSENDDCTFKVIVQRTTSKQRDAEYTRYRDQFFVRMSDTVENARADFTAEEKAAGREYSGGLKTTLESRANPDGTFTKKVSTERERPVSDAVVEKQMTLRGLRVTTTNRHQSVPYPSTDLLVGQSVRNEKTEGGLYNQVISRMSPVPAGFLSSGCSLDVFRHRHAAVENVATEPEVKHASEVGGGHVREKNVRRTDDDTYDVEETDEFEFEHEYGSRVHEDAFQAQQVIENTSKTENRGDVNGEGQTFTAKDSETEKGEATELRTVLPREQMSQKYDSKWFFGTETKIAQGRLAEAFTPTKLIAGGWYQRGVQYVADSDLTKGGRWHTKEAKYVAKPQKWLDATVSDGNSGHYEWTFRNLTQEQCQEVLEDVLAAIASDQYSTYACHPHIRRNLNDFGLYDGSAGFEARAINLDGWKSKGSVEPQIFLDLTWTEKSEHIRPVSELDPARPTYCIGESPIYEVTVVYSTYNLVMGVGKALLTANVAGGIFWASPSISYDPTTERFTLKKMTEQHTEISLQTGTSNMPATPPSSPLTIKQREDWGRSQEDPEYSQDVKPAEGA